MLCVSCMRSASSVTVDRPLSADWIISSSRYRLGVRPSSRATRSLARRNLRSEARSSAASRIAVHGLHACLLPTSSNPQSSPRSLSVGVDSPQNHRISLGLEDVGEPDVLPGKVLIAPNDALCARRGRRRRRGSPGCRGSEPGTPPPAAAAATKSSAGGGTDPGLLATSRRATCPRVDFVSPPQPATKQERQDQRKRKDPRPHGGDSTHAANCDKFRARRLLRDAAGSA